MFSAVPPTTHALPKNQRVRLMRSARKLGDLLGTTPLLVEPCEPIPVPPAPETDTDTNVTPPTSILDPTSTSGHARSITIASVLSLDTLALHPDLGELTPGPEAPALPAALVPAAAPAPARPTLLVRINTHPPQGARARSHSQAYGRPAYSTPPSPVSPTPEPNAAARRRKMARVTRTFGESVPQELVFPPPRARSHSSTLVGPGSESEKDTEEGLEGAMRAPPPSAFTFESARRSSSSSGRQSSASVRSRRPLSTAGRPSSSPERVWFPHSIRRSASQKCGKTDIVGRRSEKGWTGEWNVQDMREVVKGLRELKNK